MGIHLLSNERMTSRLMEKEPRWSAMGGCLGSSSGCRRLPAKMSRSMTGSGWKRDPRLAPIRISGSGCVHLPLYPQWPRMKSFEGVSIGPHHWPVTEKSCRLRACFLEPPPSSLPAALCSDEGASGWASGSPGTGLAYRSRWMAPAAFGSIDLTPELHRRRYRGPALGCAS